MKRSIVFMLSLPIILGACNSEEPLEEGYEGYTLVWSDEFNSTLSGDWGFETGDGTDYGLPPGWGNAELQLYTNSSNNANIQPDGDVSALVITAKKEAGDDNYSSAKLTTESIQGFRFGRIEARIKVPQGKGMWPAFWLLGENRDQVDWPGCGEIDIMEVIGSDPFTVHSTVHYATSENKLNSDGAPLNVTSNLAEDYHIYRVDWTPENLTFFMDDTMVHEVAVEADMKEFLRSFYLIFNVAVGGNWPGSPDFTTSFPQKMYVDWVRYYTKDGFVPDAPPELNIEEETIGSISTLLAEAAFNTTLDQFGEMTLKSFGDGGEPDFEASASAIEGDSSLLLTYPGTSWGGAFFELDPTVDASIYANGNLKFSAKIAPEIADMEVKLESVATAASLFLVNYTPVDVGDGFMEYTIPMSDFTTLGLDLTDLKIPFALWNPVDSNGNWIGGEVFVDNIYFEE